MYTYVTDKIFEKIVFARILFNNKRSRSVLPFIIHFFEKANENDIKKSSLRHLIWLHIREEQCR